MVIFKGLCDFVDLKLKNVAKYKYALTDTVSAMTIRTFLM